MAQPKKPKWEISDKINLCLAIFTALLFAVSVYDSNIAESSAHAATDAAKIAQRTLDEIKSYNTKSLKKQQDAIDSTSASGRLQFSNDTSIISIQKNSLKEVQRNFELTNRAYLQASSFDTVGFHNATPIITFVVSNLGQQPAKIIAGYEEMVLDSIFAHEYRKSYTKNPLMDIDNTYILNGVPQPKHLVMHKPIPSFYLDKIIDGSYSVFIHGKYLFMNIATNKKSVYEFAAEMNLKNGKLYRMLKNDTRASK